MAVAAAGAATRLLNLPAASVLAGYTWRMKNILRSAFVAGFIALLCACGAKGPLFMPEQAPPLELPEPVDADADADADAEPEVEEAPEEAATPPDDAG